MWSNNREGEDRPIQDFPGGLVVTNPPSNAEHVGSIAGRGINSLLAVGQVSPGPQVPQPAPVSCCYCRLLAPEPVLCNRPQRRPSAAR